MPKLNSHEICHSHVVADSFHTVLQDGKGTAGWDETTFLLLPLCLFSVTARWWTPSARLLSSCEYVFKCRIIPADSFTREQALKHPILLLTILINHFSSTGIVAPGWGVSQSKVLGLACTSLWVPPPIMVNLWLLPQYAWVSWVLSPICVSFGVPSLTCMRLWVQFPAMEKNNL